MEMKALSDPEGAELSHLIAACQLPGKHVLEIGCGSGKFTWKYAGLPRQVLGIDPSISKLYQANDDRSASLSNVSFLPAVGEALPILSQTFDIVLFASSL
jgi:ubiquinone/menaquinone biosynthesis C-methylase UbiE